MDLVRDRRRPARQHARVLADRAVAAARHVRQHAVKPHAAAAAAAAAAAGAPLWRRAARVLCGRRAEGARGRGQLLAAVARDREAGALARRAAVPLEGRVQGLARGRGDVGRYGEM